MRGPCTVPAAPGPAFSGSGGEERGQGRTAAPWVWVLCLVLCLAGLAACGATSAAEDSEVTEALAPLVPRGWSELTVRSSLDGSDQPVRLFMPQVRSESLAVVLHLHTWSADLTQEMFLTELTAGCAERGWAILAPNFRGPNWTPQACASALAVQDIHDALEHLGVLLEVGPVYVHGVSGGGHMALVLAGHAPRRWAGVSAWVPITDLERWHGESKAAGSRYWTDLEKVCGGPPGPATEAEYRARSPLAGLSQAGGVPIDLNAGIRDGHEGSVPVGHSLRAFDRLAAANGEPEASFGEELIATLELGESAASPRELEGRAHGVLLRREAGPARVTLFDGGHEGDPAAALGWFQDLER